MTYLLVCKAHEHRRRLVKREKPITRWDALGDEFAERISDAYAQFPMRRFDTIGLHADQVVNAILAVDVM